MVGTACELGGLAALMDSIQAARGVQTLWVAVKPNIVDLKKPGSGVITDWRVVKAIIQTVHGLAPDARISIAEGGAWIPPERQAVRDHLPWAPVGDGFALAGYRQLLTDPDLAGVDLDIVDLNFDDPVELPVPGQGYAQPSFHVPRTVHGDGGADRRGGPAGQHAERALVRAVRSRAAAAAERAASRDHRQPDGRGDRPAGVWRDRAAPGNRHATKRRSSWPGSPPSSIPYARRRNWLLPDPCPTSGWLPRDRRVGPPATAT